MVECTVVIRPDSMPKASLTTWSQRGRETPIKRLNQMHLRQTFRLFS